MSKPPATKVGVIVYHRDYNTDVPIDLVTLCFPIDEWERRSTRPLRKTAGPSSCAPQMT